MLRLQSLSFVILFLVLPFINAQAQIIDNPVAIFKATADYIVTSDSDGNVSAFSGTNGKIVAQHEDASTVIQKAIDFLPVNGGKVFLASGNYRLTKTIVIKDKHGVHLEGAARGMQGHKKGGTVLFSDQSIDLLEIFGDNHRIFGVTVSNLLLFGSGRENGKSGIYIHGTTDVMTFYNVGANNCGIGFYLKGETGKSGSGVIDAPQIYFCDPQQNGTGIVIERCHYGKIVGGEVSDNLDYGILLSSPDTGHQSIQSVKIMSVTGVRNGKAGILVGKNTSDITIGGGTDVGGTRNGHGIYITDEKSGHGPTNIIINGIHSYNNSESAIAVEKAQHIVIQGCILSGHKHQAVENEGQKYGILVKTGTKDVSFMNNIIYGNLFADVHGNNNE